jgi:hypothetical protein
MGCDIHLVLEAKASAGTWHAVESYSNVVGNESHDLFSELGAGQPEKWTAYWKVRRRNYELFAALAGVRGHGPGPRGLPKDISAFAREQIDGWGADGHSHTWYTLRECGSRFLAAHSGDKALTKDRYTALADLFGLHFLTYDEENLTNGDWLDTYRVLIWFDN